MLTQGKVPGTVSFWTRFWPEFEFTEAPEYLGHKYHQLTLGQCEQQIQGKVGEREPALSVVFWSYSRKPRVK